ncbi:MAG: MerR family transcriptional regulator [Deltaproteobacteria bacterium]|nr:MerR family transcriptional regulator [Deltaproteobacteria bacterium]
MPRPLGEGRASYYVRDHLERLLRIKTLSSDEVSLERIREVMAGAPSPVPPKKPRPGTIEVKSHVLIAPGLELLVSPKNSLLDLEKMRVFVKGAIDLAQSLAPQGGAGPTVPRDDRQADPEDQAQGGPPDGDLVRLDEAVERSLRLDAETLREAESLLSDPRDEARIADALSKIRKLLAMAQKRETSKPPKPVQEKRKRGRPRGQWNAPTPEAKAGL